MTDKSYMVRVYGDRELASKCIDALLEHGIKLLSCYKDKEQFINNVVKGYIVFNSRITPGCMDWNKVDCDTSGYIVISEREFFEMFPVKNKTKTMKKSDLKPGDLTVYRNGSVRMFLNDRLSGHDGGNNINLYNDDLTIGTSAEYDIVKVYRAKTGIGTFVLHETEIRTEFGDYQVIWERPVPVKIKLNNSYEALVEADKVKVGCQTFSFEKLEEVYLAAKKLQNS